MNYDVNVVEVDTGWVGCYQKVTSLIHLTDVGYVESKPIIREEVGGASSTAKEICNINISAIERTSGEKLREDPLNVVRDNRRCSIDYCELQRDVKIFYANNELILVYWNHSGSNLGRKKHFYTHRHVPN